MIASKKESHCWVRDKSPDVWSISDSSCLYDGKIWTQPRMTLRCDLKLGPG